MAVATDRAKVIVVGARSDGVTAAPEVARAPVDVSVLERHAEVGGIALQPRFSDPASSTADPATTEAASSPPTASDRKPRV
jgi:heterodisulfide reductase subunit A-like polyferredoxin